ncbi:MAG: putative 2-aminoethylphosphonate ABC transporter permease subunit, partial [candidate division NC10 bacterium]
MSDSAISVPKAARARSLLEALDLDRWLTRGLILLVCLWMLVLVVLPLFQLLSKSLLDRSGNFVGLDNFIHYFRTPALSQSLYNSLSVSLMTTVISVSLGFLYAYAL